MSTTPARPDHRDLGRDLELFTGDPMVGAGLPSWLPAGAIVRDELARLAADIARDDCCLRVHTPVLAKRALFERSGHWAKFADEMFAPMRLGDEAPQDELVLRPANCPHHAMLYAARRHSYRELPIRYNELASMFRAERSGVVSGLSRVRQITLDDTHVFCRPDQVEQEALRALRSALRAQRVLGLPVDHVRLSMRGSGPEYLGDPAQWQAATEALRSAAAACLADAELPLLQAPGEAAFYGPKLDLQVRTPGGQEETIATVQVDFVQPDRFGLTYDAADDTRRPVVMIHRGTVGSMERVTAAVLERYAGRLPLWLAPVQVCVLPVDPECDPAAHELLDALLGAGLRAVLEPDGSLGARIRASRGRRDAVMAVIGAEERASGAAQVTDAAQDFRGRVTVPHLVSELAAAYTARRPPQWDRD